MQHWKASSCGSKGWNRRKALKQNGEKLCAIWNINTIAKNKDIQTLFLNDEEHESTDAIPAEKGSPNDSIILKNLETMWDYYGGKMFTIRRCSQWEYTWLYEWLEEFWWQHYSSSPFLSDSDNSSLRPIFLNQNWHGLIFMILSC